MATLDILTLAEGQAALERGDASSMSASETATISALITAASIRLDEVIGCAVQRAIAGEVHSVAGARMTLKHWPLVSVSSVVEDGVTLSATDYARDDRWGVLWRQSGGGDTPWSTTRSGITVTYTAGRAANTAAVDARIKVACQIVVRHMWEQDRTLGAALVDQSVPMTTPRSFSVPRRALDLVRDLVRVGGVG